MKSILETPAEIVEWLRRDADGSIHGMRCKAAADLIESQGCKLSACEMERRKEHVDAIAAIDDLKSRLSESEKEREHWRKECRSAGDSRNNALSELDATRNARDTALLRLGDAAKNDEERVAKWASTVARVEEERDAALLRLGSLIDEIRCMAGEKEWDSSGNHTTRGKGLWWCSECGGSIDTGHKDPCVRKHAFVVERQTPYA